MNIHQTLKSLELLIDNIKKSSPVERLYVYSAIKKIFDEIEDYIKAPYHAEENPTYQNAKMHLLEMSAPLKALCGFESNNHPESTDISRLLTGVNKLRSPSCFKIESAD